MADTFEEAIRSLSTENADTRPVCVIDNDLRTITTPSNFVLGVYNDKDVHEILFSMPRYYNDIDLSDYSIRVNYINAAGTENDYYVETKEILDDTIKFSWLTSRMVFSSAGEVRFIICLRNTDKEGVITNEFNTTIVSGIVLEGIEVDGHQEDPEISDLIVKITKAKEDAEAAAKQSEENVTHYPKIENGKWIVYDANNDAWVDTDIAAQGPKGDTGETGAKGDTGKTPDFHIGAVYNVPYGQSATASITGTPERPILSLAIPEGARGAKGDTGATGPKGDTGAIGTPLVASTASEMTDTTRIYIYTGSESGYSNGHWYHYDGTAWVDGGLYNAVAFQTDKSLSVEGMAADSAATGAAITDLKADLSVYKAGLFADYDKTPMHYGFRSWLPLVWESGIISNGEDLTNSKYARTKTSYYITSSHVRFQLMNSNYSYRLVYYNASKAYVTQSSWKIASESITITYPFVRVLVKANDSTDVNPSDVQNSILVADSSIIFPDIDAIAENIDLFAYRYDDIVANNLFPYIDIEDAISSGDQVALRVSYRGDNLSKAYVLGVLNENLVTLVNPISLNETVYLTLTQPFEKIRIIFALSSSTSNIDGDAIYINMTKYSINKSATLANRDLDLSGKRLSILGVSFDTYTGYIPTGNASYYSDSNLGSVYNTWWKKLISLTGATMLVNNSWSGACASTVNGLDSSGVQRSLALDDGTNVPDYIIVGSFVANDWVNSAIGGWEWATLLPNDTIDLSDSANYALYKDTIETYSGAMATIFNRLMMKYPNAKIYAMDLYNYSRSGEHNPTGNSAEQNIMVYNKELHRLCDIFGVGIIEISKCGINAINSADYTVETGTTHLHPNANGHTLICNAVLKAFRNN